MYEEPYHTLWGWPQRWERAQAGEDAIEGVVKGLPAAAGIVEGVARVVTGPEDFDKVKSGEILVCIMTNPAWVVLFSKIKAVVTDTGGVLAHTAVVAREFGIPGVVGTGDATYRIKDGRPSPRQRQHRNGRDPGIEGIHRRTDRVLDGAPLGEHERFVWMGCPPLAEGFDHLFEASPVAVVGIEAVAPVVGIGRDEVDVAVAGVPLWYVPSIGGINVIVPCGGDEGVPGVVHSLGAKDVDHFAPSRLVLQVGSVRVVLADLRFVVEREVEGDVVSSRSLWAQATISL